MTVTVVTIVTLGTVATVETLGTIVTVLPEDQKGSFQEKVSLYENYISLNFERSDSSDKDGSSE